MPAHLGACSVLVVEPGPMSVTALARWTMLHLAQVGAAFRLVLGRAREVEEGPAKGLWLNAGRYTRRFVSGRYERPVQDALASVVKPAYVCCDIGANLGFFSLLLSRLAGPDGAVYAFEPVPKNAATIERNARLNHLDNVKVLTIALSRLDGRDELLLACHVGGAVLESAGTPPDPAGRMAVETARLDTLVEGGDVKPPHVVKIDVEGAEMDVLEGMEQVLRKWAPTVVLELDDETAGGCEKKVSSCRSFLHGMGYRTEVLPNSYPDGQWFVRHILAQRDS